MGELIAAAFRIGTSERIQIGKESCTPERHEQDEGCEHRNQKGDHAEEQPRIHAAEKQHAHRHHQDDDQRTQVGLAHDQKAHDRQRNGHGHEGAPLPHDLLFAHRIIGRVQNDEELHQLGGLDGGEAQRDPAHRTPGPLADDRHEHQDQQYRPDGKQRPRQLLPALGWHGIGKHAGHQRHADGGTLANEVERGRTTGGIAPFQNGDGGGIHHHQPQPQQQRRHPHQRGIETLHGGVFERTAIERTAGGRAAAAHGLAGPRFGPVGAPQPSEGGQQVSQPAQHGCPASSAMLRTAWAKTSPRCA